MAVNRDYYKILGVNSDATQDEIKKKWRELTRKYHPDANKNNPNAETLYKEINAAYEILGNKEARAKYDAEFNSNSNGFNWSDFSDNDIFSHFRDFESAFRNNARNVKGRDVKVAAAISVKDAYSGTKINVKYTKVDKCPTCNGNGSKTGNRTTCPTCNGSGNVRKVITNGHQHTEIITTCPICNGKGWLISDPCQDCHGTGTIEIKDSVNVVVKPGTRYGELILVPGKGFAAPGINGENGDLYVQIIINSDDKFIPDKSGSTHVIRLLNIDYTQAILGDTLYIKSIDETRDIKVEIPAGSEEDTQIRIEREGLRTDGSMIVVVKIIMPTPDNMSPEEKKLLKKIQKIRKK